MAKQTQTNKASSKPVAALTAAATPAVAVKKEGLDTETEQYLKLFGKENYLAAITAAHSTILQVRDADIIINTKRGGNAKLMLELAQQCVTLTMSGERANLGKAAELMKAACAYAEEKMVEKDANENGGTERPIADIVPSWPPMRTNCILGMSRAKINPAKVANFTAIEKGYAEWKKDPKNASQKDGRGRKATATDKAGSDKAPVIAKPLVDAGVRKHLSKDVEQAVAKLLINLATCNENTQADAATKLESLAAWALAEGQKQNAATAVKTVRMPAREAEKGAGADA